jgi:hypothetical protein
MLDARNHKTNIALGALSVAALGVFFARTIVWSSFDITQTCTTQESYHIHANLKIVLGNQQVDIPEGIGKSPTCYRWIHTHDNSGKIHVEAPYAQELTLGDFFKVWGQPLSRDNLMGYKPDGLHTLMMSVNGKVSDAWEQLVLKDGQTIVLMYH